MRSPWLLVLILAAGVATRPVRAEQGEGMTANSAMSRVESTRAQAFGGGAVAVGNDPTLVLVNPAAAARADAISLTAGGNQGDFGDVVGEAAATVPWGPGALSGGLHYYDAGQVDMYTSAGDLWSAKLQQDLLLTAGYAGPLSSRVTAGGTVKYLWSRFAESVSAATVAGDLGAQVRISPVIKIGAALLNAGAPLRYEDSRASLPTTLRVGTAAGWRFASLTGGTAQDTLILVADADWLMAEQAAGYHGGVEYQWRGLLAVRGGGRSGTAGEPRGIAAGIGLRMGPFRMDYTIHFGGIVAIPQTASLTVELGRHAPTAPPASATLTPGAPVEPPAKALPLALPDQQTQLLQPVELIPAPEMSATAIEPVPPPPAGDGMIDDLNRRLDELMDQDRKEPEHK